MISDCQFWILVSMIIIGFGCTIKKTYKIETKLTVIDTILSMIGMSIKDKR